MGSLGRHFGGPLYEREVLYLMQNEFAMTGEDVLWRRSKKGLFVSIDVAAEVDRWMALRIIRSNVQVDSSRLNSAGLANDIDDKSK
jgi:glycerol-3-phosphate dehydrogenase